jgi:hypothetical protein
MYGKQGNFYPFPLFVSTLFQDATVVGCWLLVVGCWLLVVGCWFLVSGCRLPVAGVLSDIAVLVGGE